MSTLTSFRCRLVHPALTAHFDRPDGAGVPFISANTLHIIDQALWMLPFTTKTDLEAAAKQADVSVERRTAFLNTIRDEHSLPHARAQLQSLWSTWLENNYPDDAADGDGGISNQRARTPTKEDTAAAIAALAHEEAAAAAAGAADRIPSARAARSTGSRPTRRPPGRRRRAASTVRPR